MVVADFFVEFVAGFVSLSIDSSVEFTNGDQCNPNSSLMSFFLFSQYSFLMTFNNFLFTSSDFFEVNLYARFAYGLGFEIFTVLMIIRHFHQIGPWENLKSSISKINSKIFTRYERLDKADEYFDPLEEDLIQLRQPFKTVSDIVFTLSSSTFILIGIIFSIGAIENSWFQ